MDIEAIVDEQCSPEDLKKAEQAYLVQQQRGEASERAVFTYAHCLIRSTKEHAQKGVHLLEDLLQRGEGAAHTRDYIYYLALAHTRLKNYDTALTYVQLLQKHEPGNQQVKELGALVDRRMKRDGLLGGIIVGGGMLAGGLAALGMGIWAATRKS